MIQKLWRYCELEVKTKEKNDYLIGRVGRLKTVCIVSSPWWTNPTGHQWATSLATWSWSMDGEVTTGETHLSACRYVSHVLAQCCSKLRLDKSQAVKIQDFKNQQNIQRLLLSKAFVVVCVSEQRVLTRWKAWLSLMLVVVEVNLALGLLMIPAERMYLLTICINLLQNKNHFPLKQDLRVNMSWNQP